MRCSIAFPTSALGLLLSTELIAQTGSMRVTVPSPTAASLGKFGDIPVDFYTGVPDISIPLFTAKGKALDLPIVLRYHASGIRVEEIGGWVGMGWTLEAGGAITRTVRGIVDETDQGYYNTGYTFYDDQNWLSPGSTLQLNLDAHAVDGEPDQFFFNFAGHSGEFVIGPTTNDQNGPKEVRAIPYRKWVIRPSFDKTGSPSIRRISSWEITTEDGTRYTFAARETHTDWNPDASFDVYAKPFPASWHLTEIRAPGGDVITLQYQSYVAAHHMGVYREQFDEPGGNCTGLNTSQESHAFYEITTQRLVSVTTAAHTVTFTTSLRSDAWSPPDFPILSLRDQAQEPRLDRITVSNPAGVVLRQFQFEHDYSIGGRLTLKQVHEQDRNGLSLPPHTFTYDAIQLPPRRSFAIDHWGYYNGQDTNTTYIPPGVSQRTGISYTGTNRSPYPAFTKAGALTRITYPTGGFTEFVYEGNDYGWVGETLTSESSKPAGGLRVARIHTDDGMGGVTVRKYFYTRLVYTNGTFAERSSGVVQAEPKYDYALTGTCQYYSRSSTSKMPLGSGPVVGYTDVTVWHGENGEYGRTNYTFAPVSDPALPDDVWPYLRRTSYAWRRGHEDGHSESDGSGRMQRRVISTHAFPQWTETTRKFRGLAFTMFKGQNYGVFLWNPFLVESAFRYKSSETTTVCDMTGDPCFSTTRTFVYGNPNHVQLTEVTETKSDGTERITRMKYPADYATSATDAVSAALTAMQGPAHIHNAIIERWVLEQVGTTETIVRSELTTFKEYALGQYLPYQRFILNSPSPLP